MSLTAPTIIRSIFTTNQYFVYTPLGDGRYARWTLKWPVTTTKVTLYPVAEVDIGIVRPGKWQGYGRKSASGVGAFNDQPANGHQVRLVTTAGAYIEWDIPDGHNRVHVRCRTASTYGLWNILMNGGTTGLDITSIDLDAAGYLDGGVMEFVVCTNLTGTGNTIRFTADVTDDNAYIIGIHSFDDDGVGDPSKE